MHRAAQTCSWILLATLATSSAHASDFWDEVRTPGLTAYRADVETARNALGARRLAQATTLATEAIARLPDRPEAFVVRGFAKGEAGEVEAVTEGLLRALELDASALDDPSAGSRAAELLARGAHLDAAAEVLARVLGRMHASALRQTVYALHGDVLLSRGPEHLQDALRAYREAVRGNATPRAELGLALALYRAGDEAEWSALARSVAAHGRLDPLLENLPVPDTEREARRALVLEATGDTAAARGAWDLSRGGAWDAAVQATLERLRGR